jgi:hypothetical protein
MNEYQRITGMRLLVVGMLASPSLSLAAADPLAQAEAAYARIEFGDAARFAKAALAAGGHTRAQMIRIYFLLGVSAAAEGQDEEAIGAFKLLLTIDPGTKVDRGLSPKLQGPILEARGAAPAPLDCDATFDRKRGTLRVAIRDPPGMSRTLVVRSRLAGAATFSESRAPSAASVDIAIPGAVGAEHLEYYYQLLDAHQNHVFEKGSEAAPEIFQRTAAGPSEGATSGRKIPTRFLVVGIIGEVLGVAAVGAGIGVYFVGKDAADRWNNDSICLANGMSRSANCSGDLSTAQTAQAGAIATFAIGGAFIVASSVLLMAAPRVPREQLTARLSCGAGPGIVGIACGGRF